MQALQGGFATPLSPSGLANLAPCTEKLIAWTSSVPKNGLWSVFTVGPLKFPIAKQEVVFSRTAEAESPMIFIQHRKLTEH